MFKKRQMQLGNMENPGFDRREARFRGSSTKFIGIGARGKQVKAQQGRQRNTEERIISKLGQQEVQRLRSRYGSTLPQEAKEGHSAEQ